MPCKDKSLYPPDWYQIAQREKIRAHWMCEECGADCAEPVISQIIRLTVHHIDHNPANCAPENLIALCAPCHLCADVQYHARNAAITRAVKARGPMIEMELLYG